MLCKICQKGHCGPLKQVQSTLKSHILKYCSLTQTPTKYYCTKSKNERQTDWIEPTGYDSGVQVWNSYNKTLTKLVLRNENQLTWYMCGPTVYDSAHIGHASSYMRFDIIRRILENYFDIDVHLVMGITDIDDKIINKANREDKPFREIANKYEVEFLEDMNKLNILPASHITRVSDHIPQIIDYIRILSDKDLAYTLPDGSLYFDVIKYGKYGRFTTMAEDTEKKNSDKRHPSDFALWKAVKPGEPYWDSPLGKGRPGWHIECSAMASGIFGSNFDVHSGGDDLKFPHHENEIAQSHGYYGCQQWVNYWLHTGYLHLEGDINKMSKSLKNVVLISDFLDKYSANQLRMMCLLTEYKSYLEYGEEILIKSSTVYNQILNCLNMCDAYVKGQLKCQPINEVELQTSLNEARRSIKESLAEDFNTTAAMDTIQNLVKQINIPLSQRTDADNVRSPASVAAVSIFLTSTLNKLGFNLGSQNNNSNADTVKLKKVMDNLVEFRSTVRQFAINPPPELFEALLEDKKLEKKRRQEIMSPLLVKSDSVREDLKSVNITIKDIGKESTWLIED